MANITLENLNALHWFLAYAGAVLHLLMKLAENIKSSGFTFKGWIKQNILAALINAICIPVVLIVITETSLQDVLPINYLTALLVGYQTQSMFKSIISIGKSRYIKEQ